MTQENPAAEQVVEIPPAPPAVDIEGLQQKLTKIETELEQTKKGLSTAHQTLTQKDRELKSQADLRAEIKGIREDMELLAVGFATRGEVEPTDGTSRQDVLAELQKRRAASEAKLKADADALARQEYNQRANAIYAQAQTLFEGDDLKDIEALLDSGNLIVAQREVRNASKGKTPVPKVEPPKETEEELRERIYKEEIEKRHPGMYASDTGQPSGGKPTSTIDAMAKYGRGEISAEDAKKYGVKFD